MPDSLPLYVVDTSSFMKMAEFYPIHRDKPYWRDVDSLVKEGRLKTVPEVFDELKGKAPLLEDWINKRKTKIELNASRFRENRALEILDLFPDLINPRTNRNPADPYIIAADQEILEDLQRWLPLNSATRYYPYIVQEESRMGDKVKIPHVCDYYGLEFISITRFWDLEDWVHD